MQFNSVDFLLFYVLFFAVYWAVGRRHVLQNYVLLAGSYLFYGWWDWRFLGLIVLMTVSSWATALLSRRGHARALTVANVTLSLGILLLFKYFDFFGEGLTRLLAVFGWNVDWFTVDVLLPVGISFYTFQAIGYSVDVYRREIRPERNLLTFAIFIAFFPQLLAGPIERARQLLPQIKRPRTWTRELAVDGIRETLWGLFKKVAVADMCGVYVDSIYGNPDAGTMKLSIASMLFALQIYCDFSGYCNMARGLAAMLGVRLSVNFRYPYFSRNPGEFWHRWHITLMTWFRDYLYIPLGGSRRGRWRMCCNLLIIFSISGLWHGASFNFIAWGVAWGVVMVVARLVGQRHYYRRSVPANTPGDILRVVSMCYLATLTFILFRLPDLSMAIGVIVDTWWFTALVFVAVWLVILGCRRIGRYEFFVAGCMAVFAMLAVWRFFGAGTAVVCAVAGIFPTSIVALVSAEWWGRRHAFAIERVGSAPKYARLLVYWFLMLAILLSSSSGQQFIYYQF